MLVPANTTGPSYCLGGAFESAVALDAMTYMLMTSAAAAESSR